MIRLDSLLRSRYPEYSKTLLQSFIRNGEVLRNGEPLLKPGLLVSPSDSIELIAHKPRYVSRAGYKLEKALTHFALALDNKVALDVGISTGGFTDCLLQRGILKVYGVDVGTHQTVDSIRQNPHVVLFEKTNIKKVTPELLGELVDLITVDLSFISVVKIIETLVPLLKNGGELILLIKPQFETEGKHLSRHGIVKNSAVHAQVVAHTLQAVSSHGLLCQGWIESPLVGGSGNKEFLAYFKKLNTSLH